MTETETNNLFFVMGALYPDSKCFVDADPEVVEVWAIMFADLTYSEAEAGLRKHASISPYAPKAADIIGQIVKIKNPQIEADEAWEYVKKAISKYGHNRTQDARNSMPPEVWKMAERFGWREMCMSETLDYTRGQFLKQWDTRNKRERENAALPQAVRNLIGQIEIKRLN